MEKAVGKTIVWFAKVATLLFLRGLTTSIMWNLLIVEIFNVRYLSLAEGLGLNIFIKMFLIKKANENDAAETWMDVFVIYTVVLILGFIAHLLLRLS